MNTDLKIVNTGVVTGIAGVVTGTAGVSPAASAKREEPRNKRKLRCIEATLALRARGGRDARGPSNDARGPSKRRPCIEVSTKVLGVVFLLAQISFAQTVKLSAAAPASVGMSRAQLAYIDTAVSEEIKAGRLPGAVVLVARKGRVVWHSAYGSRAVEPAREPMTLETVFDVASLTKVVATATSIMILVERGKVALSDPLTKYLPNLKGEGKEKITVELLLTHRSGYAPDFDLRERWTGYDEAIERLLAEPLRNPPGTKFIYSDIGYIALGEIVRKASGLSLAEFARQNIFSQLGMHDTGFRPEKSFQSRVAPTEKRRGQMNYLGDTGDDAGPEGERWLRGEVHDPTSYRMGGVAGHAGLFSTAADLAVYCQMILAGGRSGSTRILSPSGVAVMTQPRIVSEAGWTRGLGWDINTNFSTNRGDLFPPGSFGHTGFTGTSIWIDPVREMFVIFLSNRVHPDGKGDVASLRGRVSSIAAAAVNEFSLATAREFSNYYSSVVGDLGRFQVSRRPDVRASTNTGTKVLTGIDVLRREGFKQLAGKKVGLVTNHTGVDRNGAATIDVLNKAAAVELVALFSPEHGIRGLADEKVADSKDERTGLPIYSLYGESRRPRPEQLKGLEALVFDIQDIGARFYTYTTTLGFVMEEAAKAGIPVFVLDRPNPIGGLGVEGPVADRDKLSFTAYHSVPVRHGMTLGELAQLYNQERKIGCDLRVIKMEGWQRASWFDATNLTWINPSPNMRSLTQATLYPGVGLLETTNVSVGRGTDTPFEVVGAPWIDGQKLAEYLNGRGINGVRFVPVRFKPRASVFKDVECGGLNLVITDRGSFRPLRMGIEIAVALRQLYPADWKVDDYGRLLVHADTLERVKRGDDPEEIVKSWSAALAEFLRIRKKVLLYE